MTEADPFHQLARRLSPFPFLTPPPSIDSAEVAARRCERRSSRPADGKLEDEAEGFVPQVSRSRPGRFVDAFAIQQHPADRLISVPSKCRNVLFPDPDDPTMLTNSPVSTRRLVPFSTRTVSA